MFQFSHTNIKSLLCSRHIVGFSQAALSHRKRSIFGGGLASCLHRRLPRALQSSIHHSRNNNNNSKQAKPSKSRKCVPVDRRLLAASQPVSRSTGVRACVFVCASQQTSLWCGTQPAAGLARPRVASASRLVLRSASASAPASASATGCRARASSLSPERAKERERSHATPGGAHSSQTSEQSRRPQPTSTACTTQREIRSTQQVAQVVRRLVIAQLASGWVHTQTHTQQAA